MADNNDDVGSDGLVNLTEQYIARQKGSAQVADNDDDVWTDGLLNLTKQYMSQQERIAQGSMDLPGKFSADPNMVMSYGAMGAAATVCSMFLLRRAVRIVRDNSSLAYWWVRRQQNQEATKTTPLDPWAPDFEWVPSITKYVMQDRPDDTLNRAKKYELVQAMRRYVMEQRRKSEGQSPDGDAAKKTRACEMHDERSQF